MAKDKGPLPSAAPADDKKRAIDTAMAQIEKPFGAPCSALHLLRN